MHDRGRGGERFVAVRDRATDGAVLDRGLEESRRIVDRYPTGPHKVQARRVRGRSQRPVVDGVIDRVVETGHYVVIVASPAIPQDAARIGEFRRQRSEHRRICTSGGEPGSMHLEGLAQLEQLSDTLR